MVAMKHSMVDRTGRIIDYLRVSVTDACNYRCTYCGPGKTHGSRSLEQMLHLCSILQPLGVDTIRITGGEPLMFPSIAVFVTGLSEMGIQKLTMTTNASHLASHAGALKKAGLHGINASLDATDSSLFSTLSGGFSPGPTLDGIQKALDIGLAVKLNCVLLREHYHQQVEQVMEFAAFHAIPVRFIELMPIGAQTSLQGVPTAELLAFLTEKYGIAQTSYLSHGKGPAEYMNFAGVEVGVIGALSRCFCSGCNRLRLTSNGVLRSCLYHSDNLDVYALLEQGKTEEEIQQMIRQFVYEKPLRHDFTRQRIQDYTLASLGG